MYRRFNRYEQVTEMITDDDEAMRVKSRWKTEFVSVESMTLNLDTIQEIRTIPTTDEFKKLVISEERHEVIVSAETADEIDKILLNDKPSDELTQEVRSLTLAIRSLWELLRCRLH